MFSGSPVRPRLVTSNATQGRSSADSRDNVIIQINRFGLGSISRYKTCASSRGGWQMMTRGGLRSASYSLRGSNSGGKFFSTWAAAVLFCYYRWLHGNGIFYLHHLSLCLSLSKDYVWKGLSSWREISTNLLVLQPSKFPFLIGSAYSFRFCIE